jgi:hypothetical protein
LLASIRMFEHKNPISNEPRMNILIYLLALVTSLLKFANFFMSVDLSFKISIF